MIGLTGSWDGGHIFWDCLFVCNSTGKLLNGLPSDLTGKFEMAHRVVSEIFEGRKPRSQVSIKNLAATRLHERNPVIGQC